jgi:hypothetical protein
VYEADEKVVVPGSSYEVSKANNAPYFRDFFAKIQLVTFVALHILSVMLLHKSHTRLEPVD